MPSTGIKKYKMFLFTLSLSISFSCVCVRWGIYRYTFFCSSAGKNVNNTKTMRQTIIVHLPPKEHLSKVPSHIYQPRQQRVVNKLLTCSFSLLLLSPAATSTLLLSSFFLLLLLLFDFVLDDKVTPKTIATTNPRINDTPMAHIRLCFFQYGVRPPPIPSPPTAAPATAANPSSLSSSLALLSLKAGMMPLSSGVLLCSIMIRDVFILDAAVGCCLPCDLVFAFWGRRSTPTE